MLTCTQAQRLIVRTIDDDTLSADARGILRQHLAACADCRDEYETQHEVRRLLALQIEDRLPPGFTERLHTRLARQEPRMRPAHHDLRAPATIAARDASQGARRGRPEASVSPSVPFAPASWRRGLRWRAWGVRLMPVAATLALIVADVRLRAPTSPPNSSSTPSSAGTPATAASARARGDASGRRRGSDRPSTDALQQPDHPRSAAGMVQATTTVVPKHARVPVPPRAGDPGDPDATLLGARAVTGVAPTSTAAMPSALSRSAPIELSIHPPVLAPDVAADLKLSDVQRRQIAEIYDMRRLALREILESTRKRVEMERSQIDAAIERVLTPEQRKQYRERLASQGSTIVETTPASLPAPEQPGLPPRLASPDRSVAPVPLPLSPILPASPAPPPFERL